MPSDEQQALDLFGEALMNDVRDKQICLWDQTFAGSINYRNYKLIHKRLMKVFDAEQLAILEHLMPWIIDNTIACTLGMLQDKHDKIDVVIRTEENMTSLYRASDLLNSELWGEKGWISRFSKERPTDENYFAGDTSPS